MRPTTRRARLSTSRLVMIELMRSLWLSVARRTRATESHSDRISSIITNREVESRARRVVGRIRAYVQIAKRGLLSHGQVAGHGGGVAGNATTIGDLEGPGHIRAECHSQTRAIAAVEDAGGGQGVVCGATRIGCEVARDIEDHLRRGPWDRDIGDRERTRATESHSDRISSIITNREVESRARRVVGRIRAYVQIAKRGLLSHGQVAGHGGGVAGNATTIGDLEGPGHIRAE